MSRYTDIDNLIAEYDRVHVGPAGGARKLMTEAPIADVVPRVELDRSQYLLAQAWKRIEELEALCAQHNIGNIKFNTGDYARIVCNSSGHEFAIGTIVKLEKYPDDYKAWVNDEYWWVTDVDLEEIVEEQK